MVKLTEGMVIARTRASDLENVKKLNCWGSELSDVSLIRKMSNVEVLSLSVNNISTLVDFQYCRNLQELYIRKNTIKDLAEICYLKDLPKLKNLWLEDNPCAVGDKYRLTVLKMLPQLQKLDNIAVLPDELQDSQLYGLELTHPEEKKKSFDSLTSSSSTSSMSPTHRPEADQDQRHINEDADTCMYNCENDNRLQQDDTYRRDMERRIQQDHYRREAERKQKEEEYRREKERQKDEELRREAERRVQQQQQHQEEQMRREAERRTQAQYDHDSSSRDSESQNNKQTTDSMGGEEQSKSQGAQSEPEPSRDSDSQNITQSIDAEKIENTESNRSGVLFGAYSDNFNHQNSSPDVRNRLPSNQSENMVYHSRPHPVEPPYSDSSEENANTRVASTEDSLRNAHNNFSRSPIHDKQQPNRPYPIRPKTRNSNILSAVLCLIKELDYASLEVVEMAVRCRMEELED